VTKGGNLCKKSDSNVVEKGFREVSGTVWVCFGAVVIENTTKEK